jgi:hypothetical protein
MDPRILSLALIVGACSDYKLSPSTDDFGADTGRLELPGVGDSGTPDVPDPDDPDDPDVPGPDDTDEPEYVCEAEDVDPSDIALTDACPEPHVGSFSPIVEWHALSGKSCKAQPVVGDLDGDGFPEVVVNALTLFQPKGSLYVLDGRTGALKWDRPANMGYAASPALGDVTGDGHPNIVVVKEYEHSLGATGSYAVVVYDRFGTIVWESNRFSGSDFDYVTAPILSDMDHDGNVEIIVGRVILNSDGTTRGVGVAGRGAAVDSFLSEGTIPAVADLDLDGIEEVIVGNAMYSPDGALVWLGSGQPDGMVSVANLDDDPEGEFIAVSYNTVRAVDTDGTILWGPLEMPSSNITSAAAIGDIDGDGHPEIIVAGGSELWALSHEGTIQWTASVIDESGATGASIFDFDGDGIPEVVYIDEQEMIVFDGESGAVKFFSSEHSSVTMYDYPTIADVDGDDQAEIIICHDGFSEGAVSALGDLDGSWSTARAVWNQHAYSITNINDDLTVPVDAVPNFSLYNNYHAAVARTDTSALSDDLSGAILDVCEDDCEFDSLLVTYRVHNTSTEPFVGDIAVSFYTENGGTETMVQTVNISLHLASGATTEGLHARLRDASIPSAEGLVVSIDDNGSGTGIVTECSESDNQGYWAGGFCE